MKQIIIFSLALITIISCTKEPRYRVKVDAKNKADKAYLLVQQESELVAFDSAQWDNGYIFTGNINRPTVVYFNVEGSQAPTMFFLENTEITLKTNPKDSSSFLIEGTSLNKNYMTYKDSTNLYNSQLNKLYADYQQYQQENNQQKIDSLRTLSEKIYYKQENFHKQFALANLDNMVGLYVLYRNLLHTINYQELTNNLASVPETAQNNALYEKLKNHLEKLEKTRIGKIAPDFTMEDSTGTQITLSNLFGNYLLIDFWASWCSPCRNANPHIVEIYKEFHPLGFQIIGVSFDKSREQWLKAIKDDELTWVHVSDLKGWGNTAGKQYGIRSIPHTILLDPDGRIVMNNLTHEELHEKLKEVYKQKQ